VTATELYAPSFNVTWGFPYRDGQPVHAFPNAKLEKVLPVQVSKIATLPIDVSWTYAKGNVAAQPGSMVAADLANDALNANVAVDMFLSTNQGDSTDATKATHEVMVWFGKFGSGAQPLGWPADGSGTPLDTEVIGATTL
jgi:hypothetical protein